MMQIGGINVPISFTSPARMPVSFHAYTEFSSVRSNTYPLTKLEKSREENVDYPHTKLYQSPTHDTPFKSAEFTIHKSPTCPQGFARKLHAESPAFPACHKHQNSTYSESHELPSYHEISSSSTPPTYHTCHKCDASFHFNNALHRHLKAYRHRQRPDYEL